MVRYFRNPNKSDPDKWMAQSDSQPLFLLSGKTRKAVEKQVEKALAFYKRFLSKNPKYRKIVVVDQSKRRSTTR